MTVQKPSVPKGTRDFSPAEMVRRNHIFDTVRAVFTLFGYLPIETPAMENLSTLLGKYGEEGDKLLFRILNSGNFLEPIRDPASGIPSLSEFTGMISEKGLRYDLTVPFARFVVQHQNELTFPFKRYQVQPVWRADRPQKGRYREFWQCDVDVVGSDSLLYEVELAEIIDEVFDRLGIQVVIRLNNRKILAGMAEVLGQADKLTDITVAIDKLEKIGVVKAGEEMVTRGIPREAVDRLLPVISSEGKIKEKFSLLEEFLRDSETGNKGLTEMRYVLTTLKGLDLRAKFEFDTRLARGLNYYTGTIIEVKAVDAEMGSLCGGGRYDSLTGIFGLDGVSGVGISFGADRIYDVMATLNKFPESLESVTRVLFANFGPEEEAFCLRMLKEVRRAGIASEIYPDAAKLKKQMDYANRKQIPHVVLVGNDEMTSGKLTVKDMNTGTQTQTDLPGLITLLNS